MSTYYLEYIDAISMTQRYREWTFASTSNICLRRPALNPSAVSGCCLSQVQPVHNFPVVDILLLTAKASLTLSLVRPLCPHLTQSSGLWRVDPQWLLLGCSLTGTRYVADIVFVPCSKRWEVALGSAVPSLATLAPTPSARSSKVRPMPFAHAGVEGLTRFGIRSGSVGLVSRFGQFYKSMDLGLV